MLLFVGLVLGNDATQGGTFVELEELSFLKCFLDHSLSLELVKDVVGDHSEWLKCNLD